MACYPNMSGGCDEIKPKETTMNVIQYPTNQRYTQIGAVNYGTVFRYPKGNELYMKVTGSKQPSVFHVVQLKNGSHYETGTFTDIVVLDKDTVVQLKVNTKEGC
jgi:hypothetical protein